MVLSKNISIGSLVVQCGWNPVQVHPPTPRWNFLYPILCWSGVRHIQHNALVEDAKRNLKRAALMSAPTTLCDRVHILDLFQYSKQEFGLDGTNQFAHFGARAHSARRATAATHACLCCEQVAPNPNVLSTRDRTENSTIGRYRSHSVRNHPRIKIFGGMLTSCAQA